LNQSKVSSKVLFLDKIFDIFTINYCLNFLENKSVMTFKDRWRNYKSIGIFCIVFVVFLVCFVIWNNYSSNKKQETTEEWVNISDFPTTLEIDKE
jgi:predicted negative regulator of RcsB-dependent stress response